MVVKGYGKAAQGTGKMLEKTEYQGGRGKKPGYKVTGQKARPD